MGKDKTAKGYFYPKNPEKYKGKQPIIFRSSWEVSVMRFYDEHPFVLGWMSESVQIRYHNPFKSNGSTGQQLNSLYIPDFLVVYKDANGRSHTELVEVKPLKETPSYQAISERTGRTLKPNKYTQMAQAVNFLKWKAAQAYCKQRGWTFRVITEQTLFKMNMPK